MCRRVIFHIPAKRLPPVLPGVIGLSSPSQMLGLMMPGYNMAGIKFVALASMTLATISKDMSCAANSMHAPLLNL